MSLPVNLRQHDPHRQSAVPKAVRHCRTQFNTTFALPQEAR